MSRPYREVVGKVRNYVSVGLDRLPLRLVLAQVDDLGGLEVDAGPDEVRVLVVIEVPDGEPVSAEHFVHVGDVRLLPFGSLVAVVEDAQLADRRIASPRWSLADGNHVRISVVVDVGDHDPPSGVVGDGKSFTGVGEVTFAVPEHDSHADEVDAEREIHVTVFVEVAGGDAAVGHSVRPLNVLP